jgi:fido (protein-threonine AMPylation protein)
VPSAQAEANLRAIRASVITTSRTSRTVPSIEMVCDWHRQMLEGIAIPDDAYRGAFRGSAHPALVDYEVIVGEFTTTKASVVAAEVNVLILELQSRVTKLDNLDKEGDLDELTADFVEAVLSAAAWLHGEWVRIHPFVNGNGRTARMWVLWLCSRYGLPQLLPLRPRPDTTYGPATLMSMLGEHGLFYQYLLVLYNEA